MKKSFLIKVLGLTMALSLTMVGAAFATGAADVPGGTLTSTFATGDASFDNGIVNANKSGVGVGTQTITVAPDKAVKAKPAQRTHGEYQNNTNSCASCHQTHTAAAENLLFKDGVYTTCTACHDGTLGLLNVFTGSSAGTFAGTAAGGASMHLPTGVLATKAAPGGNASGTGAWAADFTCASCHSPHGSYSDRLLNYNPNGIATTPYYFQTVAGAYTDATGTVTSGNAGDFSATTTQAIKSGGLQVTGPIVTALPVLDAVSALTAPDFLIYKTTAATAGIATAATAGDVTLNNGKELATTQVVVVMKKSGLTYVRDTTPWINDSATISRGALTWFSNNVSNIQASTQIKAGIILELGWAYGKNTVEATDTIATVKFANIARAVVVKLNLMSNTPVTNFNGIEVKAVNQTTYDTAGFGVPVSTFCASCHTDYLAKSGTETGVWSKAFRHSTTSDSYTCLKCHFAHGTDVNVMLDAKDNTVASLVADGTYATVAAAQAYMLDTNASSALKRYTGMSVCWKCHTSSHSGDMINNTFVSGGVSTTSEFNAQGANLPNGWKGATNPVAPQTTIGQ